MTQQYISTMVTKKKTKGKARKVAKQKKKEEQEQAAKKKEDEEMFSNLARFDFAHEQNAHLTWYCTPLGSEPPSFESKMEELFMPRKCRHGFLPSPDGVEVYNKFLDEFMKAFDNAPFDNVDGSSYGNGFYHGYLATKKKYAHIWNDSDKLEWIISRFVAGGTQCILDGDNMPNSKHNARLGATYANYFEQYIAMYVLKTQPVGIMDYGKINELSGNNDDDLHTLIRFYQKRIPCSCLDEKYTEIRSAPKVGLCFYNNCPLPGRKMERKNMSYCTRCRLANYCSSECQKADWPRHKKNCNIHVRGQPMPEPVFSGSQCPIS